MAMSDYTLSDLAAATSNGDGFGDGGNGGWWILLLFILLGGWNGNRGYGGGGNGGGAGSVGGNELYPWMEQQAALCNGFANVTAAVTNGFANAETAATARQMANMQQVFGMSQQLADCCCENRLGLANLNSTILSENCADRAALSDGVRDIITNQTSNTQRILDQMCADKIDAKNDEIARLRQQLDMQTLAASQLAQTGQIVDNIYNRLSTCPVPAEPVYGRQPIFTCPTSSNCGCGCGCN